jgi:hypothetical protein
MNPKDGSIPGTFFILKSRLIPTHQALRNEHQYYYQLIGFGKQEREPQPPLHSLIYTLQNPFYPKMDRTRDQGDFHP